MKLLKNFRTKSRLNDTGNNIHDVDRNIDTTKRTHAIPLNTYKSRQKARPNPTAQYPAALLEELLSYVCAHVKDDAYTSLEDSMLDGGCMLCDLRDLSCCALVNHQWHEATQNVLYHNIRIDSVHYCDLETQLAAKRNRRSFAGQRPSPPQERLQLLSRTASENAVLAQKVRYLKIPYMTREASVVDLARTVSFMSSLRYVDLPDSLYMGDPSARMLAQEIQSRCPDLRQMRYLQGSEAMFQSLLHSGHWRNLEALELCRLDVEPAMITHVLGTLPAVREVRLIHLPLLDDSLFDSTSTNASFPPVSKIELQGTPQISIEGLLNYLSQSEKNARLAHLTLIETGIPVSDIHRILSAIPNLFSLRLDAVVSRILQSSQTPPLASTSLRTLHYEIRDANESSNGLISPSESYYDYLSTSILHGSLPSLSRLYALSDKPKTLLTHASGSSSPDTTNATVASPQSSLNLTHPLHLYTKVVQEMEWDLTVISPIKTAHRPSSITVAEPESLHHPPPLSPQYRRQGRESVMVGNGFGGYLAVPAPTFAPGSPQLKSRKQDIDAWMG